MIAMKKIKFKFTNMNMPFPRMKKKHILLALNCALLGLGNTAGPLLTRLYFIHGGHRLWLSSFLQTAAFLLIFPFIVLTRNANKTKLFSLNPRVLISSSLIGLLFGIADYLYSAGSARLPVSTSSLIVTAQLIFTALASFLLVDQKFTAYSINAVVLLCAGSAVLGVRSDGDRPEGETGWEYRVGFGMMVAAAVLFGVSLPLVELMYRKARMEIVFGVVMEVQMVTCFVASVFCVVGMLVNHDFQVIRREAREYGLGEVKYYVVLVSTAIIWQMFYIGAYGVIFCGSSLLSGIIIAVLLPLTEVLPVVFFHEKFEAEKGISLGLSLWGLASYFYEDIIHHAKSKSVPLRPETQLPQSISLAP